MVRALLALVVLALVHGPARAGDPMLARQLTDRGIELQLKGEHVAALSLFDAAIVETDHPKIRYFRAKSLLALKRYDEADAELRRIENQPEVSKYKSEITAFFNEIHGERERQRLAEKLEAERLARVKAEAERRLAEQKADETAVELLRRRRSGILPTSEMRAEDGPLMKRITPLVPTFHEPMGEYDGKLRSARYIAALDRYEVELTAAKVLTVLAAVAVGVGVGVGVNPLANEDPADGARQAGLAISVVGVVSGLAAAVLWPSPPADPRDGIPATPATAVGLK